MSKKRSQPLRPLTPVPAKHLPRDVKQKVHWQGVQRNTGGTSAQLVPTMSIAAGRASKMPGSVVASLKAVLASALEGLNNPMGSEQSVHDLRLACVVSRQVELLGVVKGLGHVFNAAQLTIDAIGNRSSKDGVWTHHAPTPEEMEVLQELVDMNGFQLAQLSRAEFEKVFQRAKRIFQSTSTSLS